MWLVDVQALGHDAFGARGSGGLRDVLENTEVTKLVYDCRMDADALFHQFDVSLAGVLDIQLLDVGLRRQLSKDVRLLPGMAKCAGRWLGDATSAVAEDLKKRIKSAFSPALGGDARLWALRPLTQDVKRYAALDAWLLFELHTALAPSVEPDWMRRITAASEARCGEFRDAAVAVEQKRNSDSALAPDF